MFKMRCQVCGSTHTKKRYAQGAQLYKWQNCGCQFRARTEVDEMVFSSVPNL
jgi:hypothetical protein